MTGMLSYSDLMYDFLPVISIFESIKSIFIRLYPYCKIPYFKKYRGKLKKQHNGHEKCIENSIFTPGRTVISFGIGT